MQCIPSPNFHLIPGQLVKVSLENRDAEGLVADVDPDITSAVEAAEWDFFGDGVV
jgi:hypothetical protein